MTLIERDILNYFWKIIFTLTELVWTGLTDLCLQVREEREPGERHPREFPPQEEQTQEGHAGEEAGEEGGQDALRYSVSLHTHLDSLQRVGRDEGHPRAHSERQDHPGDDVVHRLLSLLHQLDHQPLLLRSV